MAWQRTLVDDFTSVGHDTSPDATPGSTDGVPTTPAANSWADRAGGIAHVAGNQFVLSSTTNDYSNNDLYRTDISGNPDQMIYVLLPAGQSDPHIGIKLRMADPSNFYLFEYEPAGNHIEIYRNLAGTLTPLADLSISATPSDAVTVFCRATGTMPTALTMIVTDTTNLHPVGEIEVSDEGAAMQVSGLGYALAQWGDVAKTATISRVVACNGSTPGYPCRLVFTGATPPWITAGDTFGCAITVVDSTGAVVTGYTGDVTMLFRDFSPLYGATLSGTTTVAAVAGVATFAGLSIDVGGHDYQLMASTAITGPCLNPQLTGVL